MIDRGLTFSQRFSPLEKAVKEAALATEVTDAMVEQSQHRAAAGTGVGLSHYGALLNQVSNTDRPLLARDNMIREFWRTGSLLLPQSQQQHYESRRSGSSSFSAANHTTTTAAAVSNNSNNTTTDSSHRAAKKPAAAASSSAAAATHAVSSRAAAAVRRSPPRPPSTAMPQAVAAEASQLLLTRLTRADDDAVVPTTQVVSHEWVQSIYGRGSTLSLQQMQLVETIASGNDAVCRLATGAGKSIAMLFASAHLMSCTVVVVPTRALCLSLEERCKRAQLSVLIWRGARQLTVAQRTHLGQAAVRLQCIIAIPEDVCSQDFCSFVSVLGAAGNPVATVILDEAHVQWQSFRPQFDAMKDLHWLRQSQLILLSATLSDDRLAELVAGLDLGISRKVL